MAELPLQIKVPGKLMVAGEFAVLEPYQKLVVMAVDRFVYTTIEQSDQNLLNLENFNLQDLKWDWDAVNKEVNIQVSDPRTRFVEAGMNVALSYLNEKSISPDPFTLTVRSELDDESGKKYGLGSSAAVVTSIVSAILKVNLSTAPSDELIFKLAAIAHVITQGNGSGADVAASAYGGILQYSSFQADWLINEYEQTATIKELVEKNWTYYSVKPIHLPSNIHIAVGWTGTPASTAKLVNKILRLKTTEPDQFKSFLATSEKAVDMFLRGMESGDSDLLFEGVRLNRKALSTVGKQADVGLETPLLTELCNLATEYGGAGKLSGAGGGDCGIAFILSKEAKSELEVAWDKANIQPLAIKAYQK